MNPITEAKEITPVKAIAVACGVSRQAVDKWERFGMPRTEFTNETDYCAIISRLTKRKVTKARLLSWTQELRAA